MIKTQKTIPAGWEKGKIRLPVKAVKGGHSRDWNEIYLDSLRDFAFDLKKMQEGIDFHMSSRGWCYAMEPAEVAGLSKDNFDWGADQIQEARLHGFLPPGFILEEEGHRVESFDDTDMTPEEYVESEYNRWQDAEEYFRDCARYYSAEMSFWKGKKYFIQVLVEKSDLKSLFRDICRKYRIPIANMRGWGSLEQKADMAARFREMESSGHVPVLLACGDHDPPGLSISEVLKEQFNEYREFSGWNPEGLIVERIGLNYDFIQANKLSWIDGLTTGSGKDLADSNHPFYRKNTYHIREYIRDYGKRKCEANAVVIVPELGRGILIEAIERYLGKGVYREYVREIKKGAVTVQKLIEERLGA
jgi:hypothetical protein